MSSVVLETWWLDTTGLPDLLWARLRVFSDETAEVFDLDGGYSRFASLEEARLFLLEDEYERVDLIAEAQFTEPGLARETPQPPMGDDDVELVQRMLVRSPIPRHDPSSAGPTHNESKHRRDGKHCPVCLALLRKNSARTRALRECTVCGAHPQPTKRCRRCSATAGAIWEGRAGAACCTCGLHGSKRDVIVES